MNACKYARPDRKGIVHARCYKDARKAVVIEVSDNGPGLRKNFDPQTDGGIGFDLMRALRKALRATVDFRSEGSGLRFLLTLPPSEAIGAGIHELAGSSD